MAKGQASTETLAVYAAVFTAFILAMLVVNGQVAAVAAAKNSMDAFLVASTLGSAANAVFLAGDGANTTVNLMAMNATLWIDSRRLNVRVGNAFSDWPLLTNATSLQALAGEGVPVRNANGVVSIG